MERPATPSPAHVYDEGAMLSCAYFVTQLAYNIKFPNVNINKLSNCEWRDCRVFGGGVTRTGHDERPGDAKRAAHSS